MKKLLKLHYSILIMTLVLISKASGLEYQCKYQCPYLNDTPSIPKDASNEYFKYYWGKTLNQSFSKCFVHSSGDYFLLGRSNSNPTLTRISEQGSLLFNVMVPQQGEWNNFIFFGESIYLVGYTGTYGSGSDQLIGKCNLDGIFSYIHPYDHTADERINQIVEFGSDPNNPFVLISVERYGGIEYTAVSKMNTEGILSQRKTIGSETLNQNFSLAVSQIPFPAQLTMSGYYGDKAAFVRLDQNLNFINNSVSYYDIPSSYLDVKSISTGFEMYENISCGIYNSRGFFQTVNGSFRFNELESIDQIVRISNSEYLLVGTGIARNRRRSIISKITVGQNQLNVQWNKFLDNGENLFLKGFLTRKSTDKYVYVDGRTPVTNGFGQQDGFISVDNLNFENCLTSSNSLTVSPFTPGTNSQTLPVVPRTSGTRNSLNTILLSDHELFEICKISCDVSIQASQSGCKSFEFSASTSALNPTYQWDFGEPGSSMNTSTFSHPSHSYGSCGVFRVCVTVTDANCSSSTCINNVVQDLVPPSITCPPDRIQNYSVSIHPNQTGNPSTQDNCGRVSVPTYLDTENKTNPCTTIVKRTWSVNDLCGNTNSCIQTIIRIDNSAPVIQCPVDITIQSIVNSNPTYTGNATATDLSDLNPTITYVDSQINLPDGSITIERRWEAIDDCGHKASCLQTIRVEPAIVLNPFCGEAIITKYSGTRVSNNPTANTFKILNIKDKTGHNKILGPTSPAFQSTEFPHWNALNTGEIFGTTIDHASFVYLASTIIYPVNYFGMNTSNTGGEIYRVDPSTGVIQLYVRLPNLGKGLGNISYYKSISGRNFIFATNWEDGKIYRIDLDAHNGNPTSSSNYNSYDPFTRDASGNDIAPPGELIWGIAANPIDNRLYFGRWMQNGGEVGSPNNCIQCNPVFNSGLGSNEIWSIALNDDANFSSIERREITLTQVHTIASLTSLISNPVSDISFGCNGQMLVSERSMCCPDESGAHRARLMQYLQSSGSWNLDRTYHVGPQGSSGSNCSGGNDYGYASFASTPPLTLPTADVDVWSTVDAIHNVYGASGIPSVGNSSAHIDAYLINNTIFGGQSKRLMGDIEVFKCGCDEDVSSGFPCDSIMVMADTISQNQACIDPSIITGNPCTNEYNPVCGCNGILYNNACEAREAGVTTYLMADSCQSGSIPSADQCCYTLDFNLKGLSLYAVGAVILTPGVGFTSTMISYPNLSLLPLGSQEFLITRNTPGRQGLAPGTYDDLVKFCLSGVTDPSHYPQCVLINYYELDAVDKPVVVCTDTLKFYCPPPASSDSCLELKNVEIACNPENDGEYILSFQIKNLSQLYASQLGLTSCTDEIGFGSSALQNMNINLTDILKPDSCSSTIQLIVKPDEAISDITEFCFQLSLIADGMYCNILDKVCLPLEPCCTPCEEIYISGRNISNDTSCCFALDLTNNCNIPFFGKIEIECTDPTISLISTSTSAPWFFPIPPTPQSVCLDYPAAAIPAGYHAGIVEFCIDSVKESLGCWTKIEGGGGYTLGLKTDGSLWAWGQNSSGQLGIGNNVNQNTPMRVGTDNDWKEISGGNHFALALKNDGSLWSWGYNFEGQLGLNDNFNRNVPTQVGSDLDWKYIHAGGYTSYAIKNNGTLWAWGNNQYGQIGDGTYTTRKEPVPIGSAMDWKKLSSMGYHVMALKNNGSLWAWGRNNFLQLGDGTNTTRTTPTLIQPGTTWLDIAASWESTIGIRDNGTRWAWGRNQYGQLGDGTYTNRIIPVQVGTTNTWESVSSGVEHFISQQNDESLWLWGNNTRGQVGNATVLNALSPTQLSTSTDPNQYSIGGSHSMYLDADGNLHIWGQNYFGELGNGTNVDQLTPITLDCPPETILASTLSNFFTIKFYQTDEATVACDTNLLLACGAVVDSCVEIKNPLITCDSFNTHKFELEFMILNSGLDLAEGLHLESCDPNIFFIQPDGSLTPTTEIELIPPVSKDSCSGLLKIKIYSINVLTDLHQFCFNATLIQSGLECENFTKLCIEIPVCEDHCEDSCATNVLNISTGFDPFSSSLLPVGSATSQWVLVNAPVSGLAYPFPAHIITPHTAWSGFPGQSQWISAYPFSSLDVNNEAPDTPYVFQNCFCVCQDSSFVTIDLQALADDALEISLIESATGIVIANLLDIPSVLKSAFDGTVSHQSSHSFYLSGGNYCLQAKLRNLHSVAMGLNIAGIITGVGLLKSTCCNATNFIVGQKYLDLKCDGKRDDTDPPGKDWTIELKDETGHIVQTVTTDANGFYKFQNVPIGHYIVCEVQKYSHIQNFPTTLNYEIDVIDHHSVISQIDFGNCPIDSCCFDYNSFLAVINNPVKVLRDSCTICIEHECIGWWQRMMVDWGDGSTSGYYNGIGSVELSHSYTTSGEFEICLRFEESCIDGRVCFQKDSCFSICVDCGSCTKEEIALKYFKLFGDSYIPSIGGTLADVSDFYIDEDLNGNQYCTGHYHNGPNSEVSAVAANTDCFVIKYNPDFSLCYEFTISGAASDQGLVIKHFQDGFYLTGIFNSPSIQLPDGLGSFETVDRKGTGVNVFLAKYKDKPSCALPELEWALAFGNDNERTLVSDMDLDAGNNPVLTGIFTGLVNFDPIGMAIPSINNQGNQDFYLAKFKASDGHLDWVKSLTPLSNNTGGAYPLGVSIDPLTDSMYVCGHFSNSVDFNQDNNPDLSGGPDVNAAAFVAKFGQNGSFLWAFPILGIAIPNGWHHGISSDIEAYSGGFAVSIEKYHGFPYEFNFDPRGGNPLFTNISGPAQTYYIARYDEQGIAKCIREMDPHTAITEISVDQNKNIYFAGGKNVNNTEGVQGYSFHNLYFGFINQDCEIVKSHHVDGNGKDDVWSIVPDQNMGFSIIGRTNSTNLYPAPKILTGTAYSAVDEDIFIGKYYCNCAESIDTSSCCDKIEVAMMETISIDDSCCYTIQLSNDVGFTLPCVAINILTPGWTFSKANTLSGLSIIGGGQNLAIEGDPGLPGGISSDFFKFCLSGIPGALDSQFIEFVWYEMTKSGGKKIVCRDTVIARCTPIPPIDCAEIINLTAICNPQNPNEYILNFNVVNQGTQDIDYINIHTSSAGFGFHSCSSFGYSNPIQLDLIPNLAPGATSSSQCLILESNTAILTTKQVCIATDAILSDSSHCFGFDTTCFDIEHCCDPCEDIVLILDPQNVEDSCCMVLSLDNRCGIDYFTYIEVSITGSYMFDIMHDPSWTYCSSPSPNQVCLQYNGGNIPPGFLNSILKFCYQPSTVGTDIQISVDFYAEDPLLMEETRVCSREGQLLCESFCENNLVLNPEFEDGFVSGNIGTSGNVNNWVNASRTPQASAVGCRRPGAALMWGNQVVGEAIAQTFSFDPKYLYQIEFCARQHPDPNKLIPGQVRFMAFNGIFNYLCGGSQCENIGITPTPITYSNNTYSFNWRPSQLYSNLAISPWNRSAINHGDSTSFIIVDDVCITILDSCACEENGTLNAYNSEFNLFSPCNDPVAWQIPCPISATLFNLQGDIFCTDSCQREVSWNISDQQNNSILSGTIGLATTDNNWNINSIPYSIFTPGVEYYFSIDKICGCDTCACVKPFMILPCDSCCGNRVDFEKLVNQGITITQDKFNCKAIINIDPLPDDCHYEIKYINWKDGTIDYGPFGNGGMFMHQYSNVSVSYLIEIYVVEYNDDGIICNEVKIRRMVSLDCKKCCDKKNYQTFKSLVNQGFQITQNGCNVSISAPQLGDCHYFESAPDFGEYPPPPPLSPTPTTGSWSHTYTNSGIYIICVLVSEYPNGDPTKKPCWTLEMCDTVTVECEDDCYCESFNGLSFYWDKSQKTMVDCGDTARLDCPPDNCFWTFSGNLLCRSDCEISTVEWILVNSNTSSIVASGTTLAYPAFGLIIPPGVITAGGEYDLILTGYCDNAIPCECKIHLSLKGCDEECPCDYIDFFEDMEAGLSQVLVIDKCIACFSPLQLTACDMINWYILPSNQLFATSVGNQLICHNFGVSGIYKIRMSVTRKKDDGSICEVSGRIYTFDIQCTPSPQSFANGENCITLGDLDHLNDDLSDSLLWNAIEGNPKWIQNQSDQPRNSILIKGNLDRSDRLVTSKYVCLSTNNRQLKIRFKPVADTESKLGSKLVVAFVPSKQTIQASNLSQEYIGYHTILKIPLEGLPNEWCEINSLISLPEALARQCLDRGIEGKLMVYVENSLNGDLLNSNTELYFEGICISSNISSKTLDYFDSNIRVFPNPSSEDFKLTLDNIDSSNAQLEVFDQYGKEVEKMVMNKNENQINFGNAYSPGLYFLKVKINQKIKHFKLIKINR
ncbi:MAG: T9SS type A sorting domain-containing protein [Saprospiraceae bacterium]|nr:T9SS type A sorting domain-containing protein [Saprospiraceae bacterium]